MEKSMTITRWSFGYLGVLSLAHRGNAMLTTWLGEEEEGGAASERRPWWRVLCPVHVSLAWAWIASSRNGSGMGPFSQMLPLFQAQWTVPPLCPAPASRSRLLVALGKSDGPRRPNLADSKPLAMRKTLAGSGLQDFGPRVTWLRLFAQAPPKWRQQVPNECSYAHVAVESCGDRTVIDCSGPYSRSKLNAPHRSADRSSRQKAMLRTHVRGQLTIALHGALESEYRQKSLNPTGHSAERAPDVPTYQLHLLRWPHDDSHGGGHQPLDPGFLHSQRVHWAASVSSNDACCRATDFKLQIHGRSGSNPRLSKGFMSELTGHEEGLDQGSFRRLHNIKIRPRSLWSNRAGCETAGSRDWTGGGVQAMLSA